MILHHSNLPKQMPMTFIDTHKYEVIAQNFLQLRKQHGLTQEEVAKQSGLSVSTIRKFEKGNSGKCRILTLYKLCRFYGVHPKTVLMESN